MYLWTFVSRRKKFMFSSHFLRSFRVLLFPFALLYWFGIAFRNFLYNKNILRPTRFGLPLICVGNLAVGGTGKSPMVEFIIENLKSRFRLATLSRGYKRKTRGYALADNQSTALDIGDEPMQFHMKFPDVPVAVGEQRLEAIPQLLHDFPDREAIILDDAFQHRKIEAGLNILLTEQQNLFTRDFYLPAGDLRDQKISYRRAQVIIVTKCKPGLDLKEREKLLDEIRPMKSQEVFFTRLDYGLPYHLTTRAEFNPGHQTEILLVTGIANPRPLKKMLEEHSNSYHMLQFPDHHIFTIDDLSDIQKRFDALPGKDKIILTTEKDAVRLEKFQNRISGLPFYVIPIRHGFLFDDKERFINLVAGFIRDFRKPV
jgi:tetraacyldisaccharide 4'-kinase